jgi:hypothetical protein
MNKIINFQDWKAEVNGQILTVTKNNESREYDIKEKIVSVDYEEESEYFYIRTFGRTYYQFKFEVDDLLVGDLLYSIDNEFADTFACFQFGEV